MIRSVAVVMGAAVLLAGCGSGDDRPIVLIASSLRPALEQGGPDTRRSFLSSGAAASQIRLGVDVDAIVSADPAVSDALAAEGLIGTPVEIARNGLAVLVPQANPRAIQAIEDLARPGTRVAIASDGVPLGDYTRTFLETGRLDGVRSNVVTEEPDAASVVAKLQLGVVDAAIGYRSDLTTPGLAGFALPEGLEVEVRYTAAVVLTGDRRKSADAYVAWLRQADARERLRAAGLEVP